MTTPQPFVQARIHCARCVACGFIMSAMSEQAIVEHQDAHDAAMHADRAVRVHG